MSNRDYSALGLPRTIPGAFGIARHAIDKYLRPHWALLPPKLAKKVSEVYTSGDSLTITIADMDSLSDEAWALVQQEMQK